MSPPLTLAAMSIPVWLSVALAMWPSREQRAHRRKIRKARQDRKSTR